MGLQIHSGIASQDSANQGEGMKKKEVTKTAPMIVVTNEEGEALPHNQNFACRDLQGQSWQTGFFELALRDINMQVRFF